MIKDNVYDTANTFSESNSKNKNISPRRRDFDYDATPIFHKNT